MKTKQNKVTRKESKLALEVQSPSLPLEKLTLKTLDVPRPQIEQFEFKGLDSIGEVYSLDKYLDAKGLDFVMGEQLDGVHFFIVGGWRKRNEGGEQARMILRIVTLTEVKTTNLEGQSVIVGGPQKLVHVSLALEKQDGETNVNREYILRQAIEAQKRKAAIGPCTMKIVALKDNKKFMDIVMLADLKQEDEEETQGL